MNRFFKSFMTTVLVFIVIYIIGWVIPKDILLYVLGFSYLWIVIHLITQKDKW